MRLIVTAFSLCPGQGSEPGVGWGTVVELAREHEVHALVDKTWEPRVTEVFNASEHPRIHLHFVGIPVLSRMVVGPLRNRFLWGCYYYLWQVAALLAARRLHAIQAFDACQHVTFVKHSVPSFLHCLDIPFLWGPVGGAERAPSVFFREFGIRSRLYQIVRTLGQDIATFDPFVRWCAARSSLALAVTSETAIELEALGAKRVEMLTAVSLSDEEMEALTKPASLAKKAGPEGTTTLLYVGRLIAWKGPHLVLRAMAKGPSSVHLRIIGNGSLEGWLKAESQRLGLHDRVVFEGELSRDEVLRAYASADGFVFPSLHDSGGTSLLEAMAAALPVICLRYGGPDLIVGEDCGWKVFAATPEEAVERLAEAITEFANFPAERLQRGAAARNRCLSEFSSKSKGAKLLQKYRELAP